MQILSQRFMMSLLTTSDVLRTTLTTVDEEKMAEPIAMDEVMEEIGLVVDCVPKMTEVEISEMYYRR